MSAFQQIITMRPSSPHLLATRFSRHLGLFLAAMALVASGCSETTSVAEASFDAAGLAATATALVQAEAEVAQPEDMVGDTADAEPEPTASPRNCLASDRDDPGVVGPHSHRRVEESARGPPGASR